MRVPVISMWQPWGAWAMQGHKTIETRLHDRFRSLFGKTVAIHSTAKWDKDALFSALPYCDPLKLIVAAPTEPGIIGTAFVSEARWLHQFGDSTKALIDCDTVKRFGLVLTQLNHFPLIPCKGKQGIWYFDLP